MQAVTMHVSFDFKIETENLESLLKKFMIEDHQKLFLDYLEHNYVKKSMNVVITNVEVL